MELWNHYNTVGRPRTNNNVEGYNRKLGQYCGSSNPNIYKAIELFKREEVDSYDKYVNAECGQKPPYRRKLDIDKVNALRYLIGQLKENMIKFDDFVTCVLREYKFECFD